MSSTRSVMMGGLSFISRAERNLGITSTFGRTVSPYGQPLELYRKTRPYDETYEILAV